jgi:hypothetical protein
MTTLLDEQLNEAAQSLADDIDFEVMSYHLKESGWSKVVLMPMTIEKSQAIDAWIATKPKDVYHRGLVFLFKEAKDATWFVLKFGGAE